MVLATTHLRRFGWKMPGLLLGLTVGSLPTLGQLPEVASPAAATSSPWAVRSVPGPRLTWFSPSSGLPVLRLSAKELRVGPLHMGGVTLGGAVPALCDPVLDLNLDEVSDPWLPALAARWPQVVQAAQLCEGSLAVALRPTGEAGPAVVSSGWRLREFAPGLDFAGTSSTGRVRVPELSLFWRGPGRGLGYAVKGRAVERDTFYAALIHVAELNQ